MPDQASKPHAAALRKGRVSVPGQVYHVTAATLDRRPVFSDFRAARVLVQALRQAQARDEAKTLAFVVMPDHVHWLMQLGERAFLSDVVAAVKGVTAHALGGRIWQSGFHDHALRQEEDLPALARYIVANPLRAGLVARVGDYSHWDAVWL